MINENTESKMKDKTFELAECLADEAFGSKGVNFITANARVWRVSMRYTHR
jgi:hypothetical protein